MSEENRVVTLTRMWCDRLSPRPSRLVMDLVSWQLAKACAADGVQPRSIRCEAKWSEPHEVYLATIHVSGPSAAIEAKSVYPLLLSLLEDNLPLLPEPEGSLP